MPQTSVIPAWIQVLQALLVPVIAFVTGVIIVLQYILAKQRWRLDLYDKRFSVFLATKEYLANISRDATVTDAELVKLIRNTREAIFLFKEEVEHFISDLYDKGVDLKLVSKKVNNGRSPDKEHEKLVDKETELLEWFRKQSDESRTIFRKYLAIDKK